ncbi:MAG: NAD(P)/FAD-dependent oxidoreductase [candidate division Zixibacteria bacterium]|nr:NAD(P)/FAD-dependent oxidoreductase [candidate division Zixibacteria bacterium]
MKNYDYDIVIIGVGSGGVSAAFLAANLGKKVAIIEKHKIGGDCTWYGCVPSKALIKAGEVHKTVKHADKFGIKSANGIDLNTDGVMDHVRSIREKIYAEETPEVFEARGIKVFIGEARFKDNHHIEIGGQVVSSKSFIISTGASPFVPPVEGLESVPYLTNETIFELELLPKSIVVLGGGPIGSEMASAMNNLGVKVTLVEAGESILAREDKELANILMEKMRNDGVEILTNSRAVKAAKKDSRIIITINNSNGRNTEIEAEDILIAVGRRPNVNGLNLEMAGIEYSAKGIKANEKLQTTASNIYAIGDVAGSYQFSHIAEYHAEIAVPNAVLPLPIKRKVNYENIVWTTFTDPEFAHAGLTENEARERYGNSIRIYRFNYSSIERAKTELTEFGLSKFICDKKGRLIGIHILGERAGDLLHEAQLAKSLGVPFHKIRGMVHVYPTYGDVTKRPAVAAYVDKLQNNPLIKILKKVTKR